MKRLYLLRHAHAASGAGLKDIERPLSPAGQQHARALGLYMRARNHAPSVILCSPALRTRMTMECLLEAFPDCTQNGFLPALYQADPEDLFLILKDLPDSAASALIIGHNPGIHVLAARLSREDAGTAWQSVQNGYEPGTIAVFDCNADRWLDLRAGDNALIDLASPADYASGQQSTATG